MSTETPSAPQEEVGSPLPAIVAGIAILGVAAFLIFGSGDASTTVTENAPAPASQAAASDRAETRTHSGKVRGGVAARAADQAEGRRAESGGGEARRNPRLGSPIEGMTMAPSTPKEPPTFETKAEEIAYYEKVLTNEVAQLDKRAEFVERGKSILEKAKTADEREVAQSRLKIVEDNYDEQLKAVEKVKRKLTELRG